MENLKAVNPSAYRAQKKLHHGERVGIGRVDGDDARIIDLASRFLHEEASRGGAASLT